MDPSPPSATARQNPPAPAPSAGLGTELRESLLLLACALGLTVGLTTAAQAALPVLS